MGERKVAGSTEHAAPQSTKRRHSRERVTFKEPDFAKFQKRINKFPCEARVNRRGELRSAGNFFFQETD